MNLVCPDCGATNRVPDERLQDQPVCGRCKTELMAAHIQAADIVVTTAQVPGRKAPRLISAAVVRGMKAGAVIVDMAADSGGNCELSRAGEEVLEGGVIILGPRNLPRLVGQSASQLYSNNVVNLLSHVLREQKLVLDLGGLQQSYLGPPQTINK